MLELCGGAGTPSVALQLLLGNRASLAGYWETDIALMPLIQRFHGMQRGMGDIFRFGRRGNIVNAPMSEFPSAHAIVSGPPCPPWSTLGLRRSFDDARATVFGKVIDIIHELSSRTTAAKPLLFFIIENVDGMMKRAQGHECRPVDAVCDSLRADMTGHWSIEVIRCNTREFGLPQSRNRIYIVGRNLAYVRSHGVANDAPQPFARTVPLRDLLHLEAIGHGHQQPRTVIQQGNLVAFKQKFESHMRNPDMLGRFAIVDTSRDPSERTLWGTARPRVDLCECLTASGPALHVFALGEGSGVLSIDRPLLLRERAILQGFPQWLSMVPFEEKVGRRVWGNAMSVPVIGCVIARQIQALMSTLSPADIDSLMRGTLARTSAPSGVLRVPAVVPTLGSALVQASGRFESSAARADEVDEDRFQHVVALGRSIQAHWASGCSGRVTRALVTSSLTSRRHEASSSQALPDPVHRQSDVIAVNDSEPQGEVSDVDAAKIAAFVADRDSSVASDASSDGPMASMLALESDEDVPMACLLRRPD